MFSLEAQSFECVKVLKKAAAGLSAAHACESCVFKINQDKLDERFQYCPLLWLSV